MERKTHCQDGSWKLLVGPFLNATFADFLGPELIRRTNYQGDPYLLMRNELKIGKEPDYGNGTPVPATDDLSELSEACKI